MAIEVGSHGARNPMSLVDYLYSVAREDSVAIEAGGEALGYPALLARISCLARWLTGQGVRPGERVIVAFGNQVEAIVSALALQLLDATAVPVMPGKDRSVNAELARRIAASHIIVGRKPAEPVGVKVLVYPGDGFDSGGCGSRPVATRSAPAFIRFSSGSTGRPKGVMVGHHQVLWTARMLAETYGFDASHRELVIAPLPFSGAWQRVAATLYSGGCVLLSDTPPSANVFLTELRERNASGFFCTPPLVRAINVVPDAGLAAGLAGCRSIEFGSAPLEADALRRITAAAPSARVFFHYGMTECSRAVILEASARPDKLHTVGRPAAGVKLEIRDDTGQAVPTGAPGQIFVRGPQLADGYWDDPQLTSRYFVDGWLATGDFGKLDQDGFLIFLGRRDDRINCGGVSFYPAEIESVLGKVGGVNRYVIAGVPDPRGVLGEVPWAFVVPEATQNWNPRSFMELARSRLPSSRLPRRVVVIPDVPLTASGKPDRRRVVELFGKLPEKAKR